MRQRKIHKKDNKPRRKDNIGDTFYHGRPLQDKVKYRHMNKWIEEEENEIVQMKKRRKFKQEKFA